MYKIVTSGTSKEVTLDRLSRNLRPQSEVYSIQEDGGVYLGVISRKALIFLVTEFADYALKNYAKKEIPEAEICLYLTRKWIEDDSSVSEEELETAANAAYAAAYTAAIVANSAANAAATVANSAANAAANAAYAAYATAYTYAVDAAADAAAAANAAGKDKEGEFKRQGNFILDFLKSGKHLFLV
jgi:hypothetical protein